MNCSGSVCIPSKSGKCPKDKIINPKTGRCVNINGRIGKLLIKTKKVVKAKIKGTVKAPITGTCKGTVTGTVTGTGKGTVIGNVTGTVKAKIKANGKGTGKGTGKGNETGTVKDPLDKKYRNLCDTGLVCEINPTKHLIELSRHIGEFSDVYAVANNNKPLAALDFSAYGRKKLKKLNVTLINEVIEYCNYKGVSMIHNTKIGGGYLKSICFLPHNYNNALKLMALLWYPNLIYESMTSIQFDIGIGLLLGYDIDNIIYFSYTKYNEVIKKDDVLFMKKIIDKVKISLEELQGIYKIVHYTTIKSIK
jgi:hypothetical protein